MCETYGTSSSLQQQQASNAKITGGVNISGNPSGQTTSDLHSNFISMDSINGTQGPQAAAASSSGLQQVVVTANYMPNITPSAVKSLGISSSFSAASGGSSNSWTAAVGPPPGSPSSSGSSALNNADYFYEWGEATNQNLAVKAAALTAIDLAYSDYRFGNNFKFYTSFYGNRYVSTYSIGKYFKGIGGGILLMEPRSTLLISRMEKQLS